MTWLFCIVITALLIFTPAYLVLNYRGNTKAVFFKGALTLVILAATIYAGLNGMWLEQGIYPYLICAGLFFGFLGDVSIEIKFLYGIVTFLIGHLIYIAAFIYLGGFIWLIAPVFTGFFAVMFAVYKILKPDFGKMLGPVIAYTVIIGLMFAASVVLPFTEYNLPSTQINLIVIGSILFVISDILLAIYKFLVSKYQIRVANLSIYFISQILIAASVYAWQCQG
jgi:uncharacterized membrane protein YhhN